MNLFYVGAILSIFALALVPAAKADSWVIDPQSDGTVNWKRGGVGLPGSRTEVTYPVGSVYLSAHITNVSQAATFGVVSPITHAKVSFIQSVLLGPITDADATLTFHVVDTDGALVYSGTGAITNGGDGDMTLTNVVDGDETGDVDTFTPTGNNNIDKNQAILIHTDGGSSEDGIPAGATIMITVVPR
ncbi:MAG: hypothetical protein RIB80_04640 [Rhodospirillales bacterium]